MGKLDCVNAKILMIIGQNQLDRVSRPQNLALINHKNRRLYGQNKAVLVLSNHPSCNNMSTVGVFSTLGES